MFPAFKQKKKNAFGFFLDEYVEEQRSAGRKISHRIGVEECALLWEKMPPEEKQVYVEKATVFKVFTKKEKETKLTSLGLSYAELDEKLNVERMKVEQGTREIETTIRNLNWDTIRKHVFYTIHCHYVVKLEDEIYLPGEIAICEFNLEDGIRKTYHRLINSGPLPVGYGYEAKHRRETVHNLPFPPYEDGISDYCLILNDIFKFIESGRDFKGRRPPFYAEEDDITPIENILQQFSNKVGQGKNFFRVLPLHKLFFTLKNKCVELANSKTDGFAVVSMALSEIEKDTYRYVPGISCEYHTSSDRFYHTCSLSVVQRYVYMICDHCCHYLKIPQKPGKHIRKHVEVDEVHEEPEETSEVLNVRIKEENLCFNNDKPYTHWNPGSHSDEKPDFVLDSKDFPRLGGPCRDHLKSDVAKSKMTNMERGRGRGRKFEKRVVKEEF